LPEQGSKENFESALWLPKDPLGVGQVVVGSIESHSIANGWRIPLVVHGGAIMTVTGQVMLQEDTSEVIERHAEHQP
jgi:hypothetical protein